MTEKDIARFWSKVNKDGPMPPHRPELGRCWVWTAGAYPNGYGKFQFGGAGKNAKLCHRLSFSLKSEIPDKLCVLHKCDNRRCVNPNHLFAGTHKENSQDASRKGRLVSNTKNNPACAARGERVHGAKLNPAKIRAIRTLIKLGYTDRIVGETFGVIRQTIAFIRNRVTWKHVR